MRKSNRLKKYFVVLSMISILLCGVVGGVMAATLTASTSLTVVNVTEFPHSSVDITTWGGAWPNNPDTLRPVDQEAYIYKVDMYPGAIEWYIRSANGVGVSPYPPFRNTINSMLCAVWSLDGGKTFKLQSWDYLVPATHVKALDSGMPDCWMGTIVHSICDRNDGECNGRNRTNLIFAAHPYTNTTCWGAAVMN